MTTRASKQPIEIVLLMQRNSLECYSCNTILLSVTTRAKDKKGKDFFFLNYTFYSSMAIENVETDKQPKKARREE